MKTGNINLRAATNVSDYALLLFGGPLSCGSTPGSLTLLQGHLTFTAPPRVSALIVQMRSRLDAIFARRLATPLERDVEAEAIVEVSTLLACVCVLLPCGCTWSIDIDKYVGLVVMLDMCVDWHEHGMHCCAFPAHVGAWVHAGHVHLRCVSAALTLFRCMAFRHLA